MTCGGNGGNLGSACTAAVVAEVASARLATPRPDVVARRAAELLANRLHGIGTGAGKGA